MKREALIRELKKTARKQDVTFHVDTKKGKGSHYIVQFGKVFTTVQSGELTPFHVTRIKKQLGLD